MNIAILPGDGIGTEIVAEAVKVLAALDLSGVKLRSCDKELKPEAMTVLEETPKTYRLLVLSDGLCDGGPLVFTVAR